MKKETVKDGIFQLFVLYESPSCGLTDLNIVYVTKLISALSKTQGLKHTEIGVYIKIKRYIYFES